jgi:hypothetical protein
MHIKSIAPILILISSILISCDTTMNFPVSDDVRTSAYEISFKYIGMDYEWGGKISGMRKTGLSIVLVW